ncbi:DUF1465 family protein [Sphingomonas sp. HT-1]|uniref:DUF1465 family protein n=1 Tax=unclassified Sphingomonas TaxID=196159 RepID=UPI000302C3B8|nr:MULTISPECIES: DUF1465 family protein [unclassified Sphingomonas]KTF68563.1 hypothetical protein ATB93_01345 [Sphingomonas sp. WG]
MIAEGPSTIRRKLIDSLYVEAMVLADETRGYFDHLGREERETLCALDRVAFSCESLKITTRLMHIIAWLLTQRAVDAGELSTHDACAPGRRLGVGPETNPAVMQGLPEQAIALIQASQDLYRRVARLDSAVDVPADLASPARRMLDRLAGAF